MSRRRLTLLPALVLSALLALSLDRPLPAAVASLVAAQTTRAAPLPSAEPGARADAPRATDTLRPWLDAIESVLRLLAQSLGVRLVLVPRPTERPTRGRRRRVPRRDVRRPPLAIQELTFTWLGRPSSERHEESKG